MAEFHKQWSRREMLQKETILLDRENLLHVKFFVQCKWKQCEFFIKSIFTFRQNLEISLCRLLIFVCHTIKLLLKTCFSIICIVACATLFCFFTFFCSFDMSFVILQQFLSIAVGAKKNMNLRQSAHTKKKHEFTTICSYKKKT